MIHDNPNCVIQNIYREMNTELLKKEKIKQIISKKVQPSSEIPRENSRELPKKKYVKR